MNVANRRCIWELSRKSMKHARIRNCIAILAIALTTILFTTLFTVAMSINHSFQEANFRQCGGWAHGTLKYLTNEQFDELKTDPLIREYGLRRFVGMAGDAPFHKSHVEIGYSDPKQAHWMYCDPVEGRLPAEGTREAATDTRILELLGVEPVLDTPFTMTFDIDGQKMTETFTLCGWWEYDEAIIANHVLLPQSRVQELYDQVGIGSGIGRDGVTGSWNMDVMLDSSMHIEQDLERILANHGYQSTDPSSGDNHIKKGVNWGYTGAQLADRMDPFVMTAIAGLLLIILFTGYLIIYNVFHISVSNDIRFYGLLKTIGTTGRQLRRMIRLQALFLSLAGIPLGLLAGYGIGVKLTPVILSNLQGVVMDAVSISPVIFLGSALFSLITVMISCRRPGRMAARVSPVEAARYTEGADQKKSFRKAQAGASLPKMAWANLGRNRSKTIITMISLSLSIILLHMTVTFAQGFDMDKYLSKVVFDFLVADAGYFQTGTFFDRDKALPEDVVALLEAQPGIEDGGRVYGKCSQIEELVTEENFRAMSGRWYDEADLETAISHMKKNDEGLLYSRVQLYGMEPYAMNKLKVLEGDLAKLSEPEGRYVAAVYRNDDYGNPLMDSHWAKLGDEITLRYNEDGESRSVSYEVAALVSIPSTLTYRYYGADEFVMSDETFIRESGTDRIMYYACDVSDDKTAAIEAFLSDLTTRQRPQFDYESKESQVREFESFRNMFLMLGGVLSFIVGLVGILNFLNAILTSILTRRRELAMLQSIGMTGRQLKIMLIWEGLYYGLGASMAALLFSTALQPFLSTALGSMFWFFTYHFTLWPILCMTPVFALLGILLPLAIYRTVSGHSIVERLREQE